MHMTTLGRPIGAGLTLLPFNRSAALGRALTAALSLGLLALPTANAEVSKTAPVAEAPPPAEVGSYDLGLMLGNQMANSGFVAAGSRNELVRGIDDALAGKIPTAEQRETVRIFSRNNRDALAASNAKLAAEFLARNAHAPGITTTPSGLQYKVLVAGARTDAPPADTDQVALRYRVSLADGTLLDSSDDHSQRQPVFRVNGVIPAWREALLAMRPGARWQLFAPPALAYGTNSPSVIPPGALLVFDLDLMAVERASQGSPRKSDGARPSTSVQPKSPN